MTTFIIETSWIEKIIEGYNSNWNYSYKEYIFNDNYTDSYSIRIPLGTHGIQAMEYSNGKGIANEYQRVYLDNSGVITKVFELDMPDNKDIQINGLRKENAELKAENEKLAEKLDAVLAALGVKAA